MNLNTHRPRRNRRSEAIRAMVQETRIVPEQLILPFFLLEGKNRKEEITSMPGIFRLSIDLALIEANACEKHWLIKPRFPDRIEKAEFAFCKWVC
jgi:porphobilinogen synthase